MVNGTVRPATREDVEEIWLMIRELADYEGGLDEVRVTPAMLEQVLFGSHDSPIEPASHHGRPAAWAHVVEHPDEDSDGPARRLAGFALWFLNTSTWTGRHGIYLEDLYVRPEFRGRGYGQRLLSMLAALCVEHGYQRLEWWVLDWNEPAIDFYRANGAQAMDEWTVFRVTGDALPRLAARADTLGP